MSQFLDDREELRCEVRGASHSTLHAAYLVGRLLNEARFLYCSAWIEGDTARDRLGTISADTIMLIARLGLDVSQSAALQEAFREMRALLETNLSDSSRLKMLEQLNRDWEEPENDENHYFDKFKCVNDFVSPVLKAFDEICRRLVLSLPEATANCFELGNQVDQVIHPIWSDQTCTLDAIIEINEVDAPLLLNIHFGGASMAYAQVHVPRQICYPWNDSFWVRTLSNREEMLNNHLSRPGRSFTINPDDDSPGHLLDYFEDLVSEIGVNDHITDRLTSLGNRILARCNVTFDLQRRILYSQNQSEELSPVCAHLLVVLLNSRQGETAQNLGEIWERIGEKAVAAEVVRGAISELRGYLSNFPLTVTSNRDRHYRIEIAGAGNRIGIA